MNFVFCYIDPGSGSYIVQAIIAAVVGGLFYFKTAWWKLKNLFSKQDKKDKTNGYQ